MDKILLKTSSFHIFAENITAEYNIYILHILYDYIIYTHHILYDVYLSIKYGHLIFGFMGTTRYRSIYRL